MKQAPKPIRWLMVLGIALACILIDQATKVWALLALKPYPPRSFLGDLFRLQFLENSGAFLSFGGGLPASYRFWIFTVGVGIILAGILVVALANADVSRLGAVGLAMLAGGGMSNWLDRLARGGTAIDFMNMGIGGLRTGVFNVADLLLEAGIVLFLLSLRKPGGAGAQEKD